MKNKIELILNYFDEIIKEPKCELNYNKPYELVIAVMLSAQTTDKRVNIVTKELFSKYPDLKTLKSADVKDIENIIRSLGSYKKKSAGVKEISRILDEEYNGIVPTKRELLEQMPMVGRKTTNVILSEIYNIPNIAVDTHVERVSKRLKLAYKNDSVLDVERKLQRKIDHDRWRKAHHLFIFFGRYKCKAKNPDCSNCPFSDFCTYQTQLKRGKKDDKRKNK